MKFLFRSVVVFCGIFLASCAVTTDRDSLFQTSTIDALLAGVFDGETSFGEIRAHGDFGIGTFDALDGEMILLDGTVFQVAFDGSVNVVDDVVTTPFANSTFFDPDIEIILDEPIASFAELEKFLDSQIESPNLFYAIKIESEFPQIKTRSVPRQNRPYPPLAEVVAEQNKFDFENVAGTVVGFRSPDFVAGVNVPGYHLHFLNAARDAGGHILEIALDPGTKIELDPTPRFALALPESGDFLDTNLAADKSAELEKVEKN